MANNLLTLPKLFELIELFLYSATFFFSIVKKKSLQFNKRHPVLFIPVVCPMNVANNYSKSFSVMLNICHNVAKCFLRRSDVKKLGFLHPLHFACFYKPL